MKYEKTKLNEKNLGKRFLSSNRNSYESLLNQAGQNKGGWASSHDFRNVKESGIPIAYFIGIPNKNHDKIENAAGLAGYHVNFSPSVTDFLHWNDEDSLSEYINRDKLSNDLFIFKRYDSELGARAADWEREARFEEDVMKYNSQIPIKREFNKLFEGEPSYQSVNLIDHLRTNGLTEGVDFVLYDNFKENIDEEVLKRINEKTGLEFIQEDQTRFPHNLYEALRNKNAWMFNK